MARGLLTLVPTRNRVEKALDLLDVFYETSTDDSSGLLFVVGTEDPRYREYYRSIPKNHFIDFPDRGMVKALNYAAPLYAGEYEAIGFMGDDHRPRTSGWDERYLRALKGLGGGFVYGNDLLMGERIPTQVAISSSIIRALGHFGSRRFTHLNVDVSWKDMGIALNRITYLDDVIIEHMHPAVSKSKEDAGYRFVNSKTMVQKDDKAYADWKKYDFQDEVNRVKRALDIP